MLTDKQINEIHNILKGGTQVTYDALGEYLQARCNELFDGEK